MSSTSQPTTATRRLSVAICGNPNCGKTTVFNAITGLRQRVGNYPGVTVEKVFGPFDLPQLPDYECTLYDIPGSYSLSAFSPDEFIAARALFGNADGGERPDLIVCMIDATNLERGLYLVFQVMQIGLPIVVGLNMIDLVEKGGSHIDAAKLSQLLGSVPVVPLVGSKGRGLDQLLVEISKEVKAKESSDHKKLSADLALNDPIVSQMAEKLAAASANKVKTKAEYLRVIFDVGGPAESDFRKSEGEAAISALSECRTQLTKQFGTLIYAETLAYSKKASEITEQVVSKAILPEETTTGQLDRVLLHPVSGPLILLAVMTLMFQSIFSWSAPVMEFVDKSFGGLALWVESEMVAGPLRSLLTDGIIGGVGSVLIFLPQIMILFIFIAILEDTGYMTRAAFLVDRSFNWCGLSGKSFIPMLSSFACAVPGVMATRTIEDRKLRIVTMLVAPLMSCSARLPVYTIMITAFIPHENYLGIFNSQGVVLLALYGLGVVMAVLVSFLLKKTAYRSVQGSFIMEMPTYKVPNVPSIAIRVFNRSRSFCYRAGTVIMAITIIIWALGYYPHSDEIAADFSQQRAAIYSQATESSTRANADLIEPTLTEDQQHRLNELDSREAGAHLRNSYFAQVGQVVEPAFRPLGWDWKITMSVLASFPAREVVIATLGTIFNLGTDVTEESFSLMDKMRLAKWESGDKVGQPLFTPPVAVSIMIFFALSCQCGATLVTIRQEAGAWKYSIFVFIYMSLLGYVGALAAYQLLTTFGF